MTAKAIRAGVAVVERAAPARVAAGPAPRPGDAVEALRRRLSGKTAREHVVLDFLSDDLREAGQALGGISGYVARIEEELGDPDVSQQKLLALALGGGPFDQIEYLAEVLANVRRRLAQVAARM